MLRREVEERTRGGELSAEVRAELEGYGERSVAFAELLERTGFEDLAVPTDDRALAEVAREVVDRWRGETGSPETNATRHPLSSRMAGHDGLLEQTPGEREAKPVAVV